MSRSEAAMFVVTFAFLIYVVVNGDAFPSALAGFLIGLNSVRATSCIYAAVWRRRRRG